MKKFYIILILTILSFTCAVAQTNMATNGANALASDEIIGGEVALAFDGDTTTGWVVTSSPVQWIQYDLGTPMVVDGYAMHYLVDSIPDYQPVSWTFQGSNNGTDWTTLDDITDNTVFVEWERFITTNTDAYRYYRLDISAAGADTLAMGEFQLYVIETPTVITGSANYVIAEEASCSGNVLKTGGSPVLQRGICYNTTGNPTLNHSYRTSSAGIGSYNTMLNNLTPNTTYYFRAFATNALGTSYGTEVKTFTTLKLAQDISFGALATYAYGDADFSPAATASSGLTVSYSSSNTDVATIVGNQVHIVGAGTTTITAMQSGNTTYYAATPVEQILTVDKKTLQAIADDAERVYGETNPAFTMSYSGFVNGDDAGDLDVEPTASCEATPISDAGTYFITASGGSDNSYTYSYQAGYLSVTKATLNLVVSDAERIYGDENPQFNWIFSGFVNGDDASVIDALPEAVTLATITSNVGMYDIDLTGGGDNNYEFNISLGTLTILKAELSGSPDDQVKAYGQANPELSYTFVGFKNDEDASDLDTVPVVTTEANELSEVGLYTLTMTPYQDKNYTISYTDGTLSVEKAFLNATVEDATRYVGEANPAFEIVYTGFVNDDTAGDIDTPPSATCIADGSSPAGNYAIEVSGGEDNNYFILTYNAILTVEEKPNALEAATMEDIRIYPNPVRDQLHIVAPQQGLNIRLMSITGSTVLNTILLDDSIDLSSVPSGLYLLTLTDGKVVVYQEKIIRE